MGDTGERKAVATPGSDFYEVVCCSTLHGNVFGVFHTLWGWEKEGYNPTGEIARRSRPPAGLRRRLRRDRCAGRIRYAALR